MVQQATTVFELTTAQIDEYLRDGFTVARGVFTPEEVDECKRFFDDLAESGREVPGHWAPKAGTYPRVLQPHLFDEGSMKRLLDPRIKSILEQLLKEEPVAVQSMFYYKPPGTKGQSLHQDNYYLRVKDATCIAAWVAIDQSTWDNGGLQLVPGTQNMEIVCPEMADSDESFTADLVQPPEGYEAVKLVLEPGDVLLFNGSVVHGSESNRSIDRWRRSFICHYMPASAKAIGKWFLPAIVDFTGQPLIKEANGAGSPCGVEKDTFSFH